MLTFTERRAAIEADLHAAELAHQELALIAEQGDDKAVRRLPHARNQIEVHRGRLLDLTAAAQAAERQRATESYQAQLQARRAAVATAEGLSADLIAAAAGLDAAVVALGDAHARVVDLAGQFCATLGGAADARGRDMLGTTALASDHVRAALVDALVVAGLGALVGVQVPDADAPRLAGLAQSRCARALTLIDIDVEDHTNAA